MWRLPVSLALAAATAAACAGAPEAPTPYPDLSDPKAAAFSLGVALVKGDTKTAGAIYAGDEKHFAVCRDALAKVAAGASKLSRAVTGKYGENAATLVVGPAQIEPKFAFKAGGPQYPLTSLIAAAESKVSGDEATLDLGGGTEIRLKKDGNVWKVVAWPPLPRDLLLFADVVGEGYEEVAGDIERGK
jgi:hypothetical protein